jgi:hypothetical protein
MQCKIEGQTDRKKTVTIKEKLIQEVEDISESLLAETLDFVLFLKSRYVEEETTSEEKENIRSSQTAYLSGDYLTLDQYEATQA